MRQRATRFLQRFDAEELTPERLRYLRAMDVLTATKTSHGRKLLEDMAKGAAQAWETEVARRVLSAW